jgi:peptide/nickel transport system permease protein
MLSQGARYLLEGSHLATFPGIAIMTAVLSLNFIGDGLRDILDVREQSA